MALMSEPKLLIMDEPTTALDVTVEAGIIHIVNELGTQYGTSLLFISHNLGLVLDVCDQICVIYSGEAVETDAGNAVFDNMRHPYTQALFKSIPLPSAEKSSHPLAAIPGNFPLPNQRPTGCNFGPRCNYFTPGQCDTSVIDMQSVKGAERHQCRCLRSEQINWNADLSVCNTKEPTQIGDVVIDVDKLKNTTSSVEAP